ncbi:mandelate racemase/muconate lactonizing enzyme family protein [Mesorhizobium sp. M4B.F.Ca.ET.089.01.1.1]|uniref:mandelate racemase/muconate lactonizing enzyme family protein n=1 Tax=Mesorhizobium sp. M4B.F.Ca.ET.089.01.1.1 TaxID=2496662 RepID=UPI000FE368DB|nr:mandelate racemase/muconate lactonizing enzyme family protein [Mesorhizobium sp. M4B.F.Ca.ET.089.01.1.1]RWX60060.1 mandelate racemase/muconate lactonizing enzyme family protein [Mesorhizobium sp. M4B.F.Ca.ET.089.01.1.1]
MAVTVPEPSHHARAADGIIGIIKRVEARLVRMPLQATTSFATRAVKTRDYVLVKVISKDGIGLGYTYAGNSGGSISLDAVTTLLAPLIVGKSSLMIEGLWERMYRDALLHGRTGAVMRALSAIDIALWDHNARFANLPLWQFLGSYTDGFVDCYASGGYYQEGKSPEHLADELAGYVEQGFKAVKMKVGMLSLEEEKRRIMTARGRIGTDVRLFLDANNAWRDLFTALPFVRCFEPFCPDWIEEPFSPDDIESHARLVTSTTIPVATGEVEAGRWRFRALLDARAAHVLQADALVCGGITEWRRICGIASAYGVPVYPHAWHDIHVHLAASQPNSALVEYFVDHQIVCTQPLFDRELKPQDGRIALPSEAGLAFSFDEETLDRYGVSDWQAVS